MTINRWLRLMAGLFVIASVLLGIYVDSRFLWFTLFVGANLAQSSVTNWCPMMALLRGAGVPDDVRPGASQSTRPVPARVARPLPRGAERQPGPPSTSAP